MLVARPCAIYHVLQCVGVCCSVLECVAVCCSVIQYIAACCSVLQCAAVRHVSLCHTSLTILCPCVIYHKINQNADGLVLTSNVCCIE